MCWSKQAVSHPPTRPPPPPSLPYDPLAQFGAKPTMSFLDNTTAATATPHSTTTEFVLQCGEHYWQCPSTTCEEHCDNGGLCCSELNSQECDICVCWPGFRGKECEIRGLAGEPVLIDKAMTTSLVVVAVLIVLAVVLVLLAVIFVKRSRRGSSATQRSNSLLLQTSNPQGGGTDSQQQHRGSTSPQPSQIQFTSPNGTQADLEKGENEGSRVPLNDPTTALLGTKMTSSNYR